MERLRPSIKIAVVLALAAVIIWLGAKVIGDRKLLVQKNNELSMVRAELQRTLDDNMLIEYQKEHALSDEAVEKYVRDKLNWIKDGETIYIFSEE